MGKKAVIKYCCILVIGILIFVIGVELKKSQNEYRKGMLKTILMLLFAAVGCVGFWRFWENGILEYMFFRTPFAFLNYEMPAALVFAENFAMLSAFALLGACCAVLCRTRGKKRKTRQA